MSTNPLKAQDNDETRGTAIRPKVVGTASTSSVGTNLKSSSLTSIVQVCTSAGAKTIGIDMQLQYTNYALVVRV